MKKKFKKNTKGITLVALVITIIILIILAGIAIASLGGENGLFAKAKQAKSETLNAQNKENAILQDYESKIEEELKNNGSSSGAGETITGIDTKITNPAGAMPSNATVIEGDATKGIVIQDENKNEWVWVEVPKTAEVYPTVGIDLDVNNISDEQCTTIYNDLVKYASVYRASYFSDKFCNGNGFNSEEEYNTAKNNMIRSMYKYGGFYIGRYEAGDADATESNTTRIVGMGNTNKPVIQINQIPYNYVTCSQAQEISNRLSTGGKTGSLMLGIQWDLTCKFLEVKGVLSQEQIKTDSKDWGNYSNSTIMLIRGKYNITPNSSSSKWLDIIPGTKNGTMLLTTGASEDTNKMNIYDLAGNAWEWTLEQNTSNAIKPCVTRGGNYPNTGSIAPAPIRNYGSTTDIYNDIGLRPTLY